VVTAVPVTAGSRPKVLCTEEIYSWIEDIVALSTPPDYRRSGTSGDIRVRQYILSKFIEFGLQDVRDEPVEFVRRWYNEWGLTVAGKEIPCFFMREGAFTEGITAQLVYAGETVEEEDDVEGKIVVVDVRFAEMDPSLIAHFSYFVYDPDNTMVGKKHPAVWVPINMPGAYEDAARLGAIGFIGILKDYPTNSNKFYPDVSVMVPPLIPALWVGRDDGASLRELLETATEPIYATIKVKGGVDETATSGNIIGILPGKTNDIIIVCSHHDSAFYGAVQDASGTAVVLAIAKYFAHVPKSHREKTLVFVLDCNHFDWDYPKGCKNFISRHPDLIEKTVLAIGIEHIAKDFDIIDGEWVDTGFVEPRGLFTTGNPLLIRFAEEAVIQNNLVRTMIIQTESPLGIPGEPQGYYYAGVPIYSFISGPEWLFDLEDTPDKVAKDQLVPVAQAFIDIINRVNDVPASLIRNSPQVPPPLPPFIAPYPGWGKIYQGYGYMDINGCYKGKGALYIRPPYVDTVPILGSNALVFLGVDGSTWVGPWIVIEHWQKNWVLYKCQDKLGRILWIIVHKTFVFAFGDDVYFIGRPT